MKLIIDRNTEIDIGPSYEELRKYIKRPTNNDRIYPVEVFDKAIEEYKKSLRIEERDKKINEILK